VLFWDYNSVTMKHLRMSEALVPVNEFKASPSKYLRAAASSGPIVITVNGRAAGVVLSPAEYDRLVEREEFLKAVDEGIAAADAGQVSSSDEVRQRLGLRRR
jgi:prevent-host-death family protein